LSLVYVSGKVVRLLPGFPLCFYLGILFVKISQRLERRWEHHFGGGLIWNYSFRIFARSFSFGQSRTQIWFESRYRFYL